MTAMFKEADVFYKSHAFLDVKEVSDTGYIKGYASTFGNIDQGGDRVVQGAYAKSIASGRKVRMLWQHDTKEVIGGWDVFKEDAKGLWVEGGFNMEVQRGREAYALLKADHIDGLSIGYRIPEGGASKASDGAYNLTELDLREVSIVTMPMNEDATGGVKAMVELSALKERLKAGDQLEGREFETFLKGLGFSNSQAERAVRLHLQGQGDPAKAAPTAEELLQAFFK